MSIEVYDRDGYEITVEFPVSAVEVKKKEVTFKHTDELDDIRKFSKQSDLVRFVNWLTETNQAYLVS